MSRARGACDDEEEDYGDEEEDDSSIEQEESPVSSRIGSNHGRQKVGVTEHEHSIERCRDDAADMSGYSCDDWAPFQMDKTENISSALSELDPRTLSGLDDCAT